MLSGITPAVERASAQQTALMVAHLSLASLLFQAEKF